MARDRTYKPGIQTKKYSASQDEIDQVREDSRNAQELLDNTYLTSYFENAKKSILELHAKQSIYDATEETENGGVKRTLSFPAKKEYLLLAGKYRFIEEFINDLKQVVLIGKEMDEKIKSEEIEVVPERNG